jgi:hypothetical protein
MRNADRGGGTVGLSHSGNFLSSAGADRLLHETVNFCARLAVVGDSEVVSWDSIPVAQ